MKLITLLFLILWASSAMAENFHINGTFENTSVNQELKPWVSVTYEATIEWPGCKGPRNPDAGLQPRFNRVNRIIRLSNSMSSEFLVNIPLDNVDYCRYKAKTIKIVVASASEVEKVRRIKVGGDFGINSRKIHFDRALEENSSTSIHCLTDNNSVAVNCFGLELLPNIENGIDNLQIVVN